MRDSFLKNTRQSWKLWFIYASVLFCWLAFAIFDYLSDNLSAAKIILFSAFALAVEGAILAWSYFSIKCPRCGSRILLWGIVNNSLHKIPSIMQCPLCNYAGEPD